MLGFLNGPLAALWWCTPVPGAERYAAALAAGAGAVEPSTLGLAELRLEHSTFVRADLRRSDRSTLGLVDLGHAGDFCDLVEKHKIEKWILTLMSTISTCNLRLNSKNRNFVKPLLQ